MNGYLLTFFTQKNRTHDEKTVAEWILTEAKRLGIRGATLLTASEGFGSDGQFHSSNFFDLEDQPIQVMMAVTDAELGRLFARIEAEDLRVFYTKAPIEFGVTGKA